MTEEQLKQNAEEYYQKLDSITIEDPREPNVNSIIDVFIAGAHSRDEEIGRMNTTIRLYANQIVQLRKDIEQLRNPWISVEERLPDEHSRVLIMFCNSTVIYNDCIGVGDINYMKAHSKTITHWMPIPELKEE